MLRTIILYGNSFRGGALLFNHCWLIFNNMSIICIFLRASMPVIYAFPISYYLDPNKIKEAEDTLSNLYKANDTEKDGAPILMISDCQAERDWRYNPQVRMTLKSEGYNPFEVLKGVAKKQGFKLDTFLLADTLNLLEDGTCFNRADLQTSRQPFSLLDKSCILTVYAQAHRAAAKYKSDSYEFIHFDEAVWQRLAKFYTENPDCLPPGLTLKLKLCTTQGFITIVGTAAKADEKYQKTILDVVDACEYKADFFSKMDLAKELPKKPQALALLKKSAVEIPDRKSPSFFPSSESDNEENGIDVLIDYDNCFCHSNVVSCTYLDTRPKTRKGLISWEKFLEKLQCNLIGHENRTYIKKLVDKFRQRGYKSIRVGVFSARQSLPSDMYNDTEAVLLGTQTSPGNTTDSLVEIKEKSQSRSGSVFQGLLMLRNVFESFFEKPVTINRLLLTDIFLKQPSGTEFKDALVTMHRYADNWSESELPSLYSKDYAKRFWGINDISKFFIVYANAHAAVKDKKNDLMIIDDKKDILVPLQQLFLEHPEFLPAGKKLWIECYDGKLRWSFPPILGTGPVDHDYENTIRRLIEILGHSPEKHDVCINMVNAFMFDIKDKYSQDTVLEMLSLAKIPDEDRRDFLKGEALKRIELKNTLLEFMAERTGAEDKTPTSSITPPSK